VQHEEFNPIRWPEPFGLVMAEALACGAPVIACPCDAGAAPEIGDNGVTGFLRSDHDGLVQTVSRVDVIDRAACRKRRRSVLHRPNGRPTHLRLLRHGQSLSNVEGEQNSAAAWTAAGPAMALTDVASVTDLLRDGLVAEVRQIPPGPMDSVPLQSVDVFCSLDAGPSPSR
jgi:hypothetical protein